MLLRIVFSGRFIHTQYQQIAMNPLDGIIPNKLFAITLIVLGIVCKVSEVRKFSFWTERMAISYICLKKYYFFCCVEES